MPSPFPLLTQVGVTLYLLYTQVSWAFAAGLVVIAVFIPINMVISARIGALTGVMMTARDERLRVTGETLRSMRVVKSMCWEGALGDRIRAARSREVAALTSRKYLDAACVYLWAATPVLVAVATFAAVVALDGGGGGGGSSPLSAASVFTTLSLLNMLIFPMNALPWVVTGTLEAGVSLGRLARFLCAAVDPDLVPRRLLSGGGTWDNDHVDARALATTYSSADDVPADDAISQLFDVSGDFAFPARADHEQVSAVAKADANTQAPFILSIHPPPGQPPSITLRRGELLVVAGPIGSGKSAFLGAILGELLIVAGDDINKAADGVVNHSYRLRCSASYAPQTPWIRGTSLRHNIVGGLPWDAARFAAVLHACALEPDVRTMADGDATVVRRSTLSGGQQARVGLARALYDSSALVLLDEPLAALDGAVAETVWRRCLAPGSCGGSFLAQERRACVLVTHDPALLTCGDTLLLLDHGRVMYYGPPARAPQDLLTKAGVGSADIAASSSGAQHSEPHRSELEAGGGGPEDDAPALPIAKVQSISGEVEDSAVIEEETREEGAIRGRVLRAYSALAGSGLAAAVLVSLFVMQLTRNGSDWWLSVWSAATTGGSDNGAAAQLLPRLVGWPAARFLVVFGGIAAANSIATSARAILFAAACLRACIMTHDGMLSAVLNAPLSFHDANPLGRLLNRFSADTYALDESLPFQLNILLAQVFGLAGTALVLTYATSGAFVLALPPLMLLYYRLQRTYRASSRELKRLESVTRSPLFSHLTDVIDGASVVRAATPYHMEHSSAITLEVSDSTALLDDNQRMSFASSVTPQWLGLRLQAIGALVLAIVAFAAVLVRLLSDADGAAQGDDAGCPPPSSHGKNNDDYADTTSSTGAAAGLALSYAIPIVGALQGLMGAFTETEKEFVSVERVREYLDVPPEEDDGDAVTGSASVGDRVSPTEQLLGSEHEPDIEAPLLTQHIRVVALKPRIGTLASPTAATRWTPASGDVEFDGVTVSIKCAACSTAW